LAPAVGGQCIGVNVDPDHPSSESPYDAEGRIDVPGAPGWRYLPIEPAGDDALAVTVEGPDDVRVAFTVPDFLSRGDELGEVARIVIRGWERMDRASGLGA
jgi:hypothetical protein